MCANCPKYGLKWQVYFWRKVTTHPETDCWIWTSSRTNRGYGTFTHNNRNKGGAHRIAYETFKGPIPTGKEIDHLCRNPSCVNPTHLEIVTGRENKLRGKTINATNAAKTHCPSGHEYVQGKHQRCCPICSTESQRASYLRNIDKCRKRNRERMARKRKESASSVNHAMSSAST